MGTNELKGLAEKDMVEATVNGFGIAAKESFPPNANPFCHDYVQMGQRLGTNVVAMMMNHDNQTMEALTLVHLPTGKRIRIVFPKEPDKKSEEAQCVEIRADGAQRYRIGSGVRNEDIWLCGTDRTPGVKVGDKGTMAYVKSPLRGCYRFTKDKESK